MTSPLGTGRIEGLKAIADALGVSEAQVRKLADPRRKFPLPVRYGARGFYVLPEMLELWFKHYDAPYGLHEPLRRKKLEVELTSGAQKTRAPKKAARRA